MDNPLLIAAITLLVIGAIAYRPAIFVFRAVRESLLSSKADSFISVPEQEIERIDQLPRAEADEQALEAAMLFGAGAPDPDSWKSVDYDCELLTAFFNRHDTLSFGEDDLTLSANLLRTVSINHEPHVIIGCEDSREFYYGIRKKDGAVFALRIDEEHDEFNDLRHDSEDIDFYADSVAKYVLFQRLFQDTHNTG